jgi:outer membrane receptor protein involved in Fe transport
LSLDERFSFAITDPEEAEEAEFREAALQFTPDHAFDFEDRATPNLWSFYVQDAWRAASRLTLSGGVRYDRTRQLLERSQWSPRIGGALRLGTSTLLRAAVSRFYQPPQPENLLLSSSPEARVLSAISVGDAVGGADLEPERQWGTEVGIDQPLGRFGRLDAAYWQRWVTDASDPNVFAGTTIIFPNAVAKGRARGVEVRLEMPRRRGWSAYANVAAARVVQTGPITGGLFLEDEVEEIGPGVEFFPDHDQRLTAGGGLTWDHASSGAAISLALRYETGTPVQRDDDDEGELEEAPGAETVDFARGRVKTRTVVSLLATYPVLRSGGTTVLAGLQVLNLFDREYAYNFGNPFSGTHFGAPRTVAFTLRVRFD